MSLRPSNSRFPMTEASDLFMNPSYISFPLLSVIYLSRSCNQTFLNPLIGTSTISIPPPPSTFSDISTQILKEPFPTQLTRASTRSSFMLPQLIYSSPSDKETPFQSTKWINCYQMYFYHLQ